MKSENVKCCDNTKYRCEICNQNGRKVVDLILVNDIKQEDCGS